MGPALKGFVDLTQAFPKCPFKGGHSPGQGFGMLADHEDTRYAICADGCRLRRRLLKTEPLRASAKLRLPVDSANLKWLSYRSCI